MQWHYVYAAILIGRFMSLIRQSVRQSVSPYIKKINVNVSQCRSNQCADFQFKMSNIKAMGRQKPSVNEARPWT